MVCMHDATHRHTISVVYCSFIWLTLASKTTNLFAHPHTRKEKGKKKKKKRNAATATAGYYFYSFKQITLASKSTDSFSLPHIHPHRHTHSPKTLTTHKLHCEAHKANTRNEHKLNVRKLASLVASKLHNDVHTGVIFG